MPEDENAKDIEQEKEGFSQRAFEVTGASGSIAVSGTQASAADDDVAQSLPYTTKVS